MGKKHVLVVDDETNLLCTLAFILEAAGYQVTTAATGQEALDRLSAVKGRYVDLLLTDIRMPDVNGLQLIDRVQSLDTRLPILVMSGYGNPELAAELERRGCAPYLDKPFDAEKLLRSIDGLIRSEHVADSEQSSTSHDIYPEDLVQMVDRHALSPIYSYLTSEDQHFIIQKVHSEVKSSLVVTDAVKTELARHPDIDWYSVRCANFGMLHSYSTVIGTEKSRWIPFSHGQEDEI